MDNTRALDRLGLRGGAVRLWRIAALCGLLAAMVIATIGASPALAASEYRICTHTSDVEDAGTDTPVLVRLHGTSGASHWLALDNSDDNFERGRTDCFGFTLVDLGTITELELKIDCNKCWRLDGIEVNDGWFPYYERVPKTIQLLHRA